MNLVQKLPIGLGLACMMILSSCSKEDVGTPTPQVGEANESSGLREAWSADPNVPPGGWNALPQIPTTTGATGKGVFAPGWSVSYYDLPASPQLLASGTSNYTHLWGAPNLPWVKPLPSHPAIPRTARFITITADDDGYYSNRAVAEARMQHLTPGKRYSVTFYAISAITKASEFYPQILIDLTSGCISDLWGEGDGCYLGSNAIVEKNKEGIWIEKTIEFEASATTATINFMGQTVAQQEASGKFGYWNIYIDQKSIKQLN